MPGTISLSVMTACMLLPQLEIRRGYWINSLSGFTAVIYNVQNSVNPKPLCQLLLLNSFEKEQYILKVKRQLCYLLMMNMSEKKKMFE